MQIKPTLKPRREPLAGDLKERSPFISRRTSLFLVLAACLVLVVAGGIWYGLEGLQIIGPLLPVREPHEPLGDGLPALYLEVAPETYQTMYRHWEASLRTGVLRLGESEWMQGQIRYGNQRVPVSLWLAAESPEHWQEDKWALQIKLDQGTDQERPATILDMRAFVARSAASGRYLEEWLYSEDLRDAGILAPRYVFAHLWMNGDDWGVYGLREALSEEFFASQGRPAGIGLWVDDSLSGRQQAQRAGGMPSVRDRGDTGRLPGLVRPDEGMSAEIERDPALQEQYVAARGLLRAFQSGQLAPAEAFDAEQVGRYLARAQWWGARYGSWFEGERYYYNAITSRLEPIGGDLLPLEAAYAHRPGLAQYGDLEVMEAYAREVERIAQPETIGRLRATYEDSLNRYRTALAQELPASKLTAPWQMLSERQAILSRSLHPRETVHAYASDQEGVRPVRIYVANLLTYPVVLEKLHLGERTVDIAHDWIVDGQDALWEGQAGSPIALKPLVGTILRYLVLSPPESVMGQLGTDLGASDGAPRLGTQIAGLADPIVVDLEPDLTVPYRPAIPVQPTIEQALARHPFLAVSEQPGYLEIEPGDWDVTGDLVLPEGLGLLVSHSAVLRFDEGSILLSDGPLLLQGSPDNEIHLVSKNENWGGVVVLDAGDEVPSSLSYVILRDAAGVRRDGWHVPGALTAYRSAIALSHCTFLDATAPAALYVTQARFECEESEFGRVSAQAVQVERGEGRLRRCAFHDVLGTAVALRSSRVELQDVSLLRVYGPGILASQNGIVAVRGGRAEDVRVAVAASDGSHIQVEDLSIKQAWSAGLAAYTSELGVGPASVHASGITFESEDAVRALAQPASSVRLEGVAASTKGLELYRLNWRQEIMATLRPLGYRLGPAIWLAGYALGERDVPLGDPLHVTFYWHPTGSLDRDYTVFVHVRDADGETVAGFDTMPRDNTYPTTAWQAGEVIDDLHIVPLDMPPGEYRLALGMYHLPSGQRLPVYGPDGEPVANGVIVLDRGFRVN